MTQLRPLYVSAITFLVALAVGGAFIVLAEHRRNDEQRQAIAETGSGQAHILERQLERSLSSTFALASVLRQSGTIDGFDALAAEIIKNYGGISSLQLAPNGVVTQIYPLGGNQEAIGHDLLNDPRRRTEALKAIESRQLTVAGPFTLIQGGIAVIGRFPVFVPDEAGGERFWGFTIALIRLPALFEASDVKRLVEQRYDYELSRIDSDSGARVVFAQSTEADLQKPIPFEIKVPNGSWTLAIAPRGGWSSSSSLPEEVVLVLLVSLLVAAFTYRILRQPAILRREVELRTQDLAETNLDLWSQITKRAQAEEALRQSEAAIRNSQKDLRILAGKLLSAQEEERRRLARELHDDLTQRLAVLAIEAASLEKVLSSSLSPVRDRVRRMKEQMVKLSADVHGISRQLHPSILDDLGLVSAIESECEAFSERDGVRVMFTPKSVPSSLPRDISLCLYRVTQEGLRNIAKHAQAKDAYVTLAGVDGGVLLTIQDRGVGFDLAQTRGKMGLGLDSMEERVRLLQGSLSVHSKPGQGTIIEVRTPLAGRDV